MGSTMGRTKINDETINARFPVGTLNQIDAYRYPRESRAGFIRLAVDKELEHREKAVAPRGKTKTG